MPIPPRLLVLFSCRSLLAANPRVCLVAVADVHAIPKRFTTEYSSAIAFGTARLVTDPKERYEALMAICEKFASTNPHREACAAKAGAETAVYCVELASITGKRSE